MPRRTYRKCSIDGCAGNVVAKELCDLHYRRMLYHGDVEQGRPTDWGKRQYHPLYGSWIWMHRRNKKVDDRWSSFWNFVDDVVARPSDEHYLQCKDGDKPLGPDNFFWREKQYKMRGDETRNEYQRRYMREYRKNSPEKVRGNELRKKFGIGIEQYDAMLNAQNGVCAICMKPETSTNPRTGLPRRLAVDHCHKQGHIRKLLCQGCNQGLGNFRDDPKLLRAAADYLET